MPDKDIKAQTDESISSNRQKSSKNPKRMKDPRDRVTPDAFTVSPDILGTRLASPRRRGLAMILDLLIIQLLSQMGSLMLGAAIAVMLILLGSHRKKGTIGSGIRKVAYIAAAITVAAVIIYEIFLYQDQHEISILRDKPEVEQTAISIDTTQDTETQLEQAKERIAELEDRGDWESNVEALAETFSYSFGWAAIYFTLCLYLTNGQTLGKWLTRIQVRQLDGSTIGIWASFGRYGGYAASFVTGLSGFFQIYWDANRQGLHDKVANTVVVDLRKRHERQSAKKTSPDQRSSRSQEKQQETPLEKLANERQQDTSRNS
ncbi:MAG: RDD family protein [Gammaproteobacteria bacterium]|nr:RDD family protein [Gammaproteobacteria bacterium]